MTSRSKKILDMINCSTTPLDELHSDENQAPNECLLQAGHVDCTKSPVHVNLSNHNKVPMDALENVSAQNSAVDVVVNIKIIFYNHAITSMPGPSL